MRQPTFFDDDLAIAKDFEWFRCCAKDGCEERIARNGSTGMQPKWCKAHRNENDRRAIRRCKDRTKERNRPNLWSTSHPCAEPGCDEMLAESRRIRCESCVRKRALVMYRERNYRNRFGLTFEKVQEMKAAQGFRCAICGRHEDDLPDWLLGPKRNDGTPRKVAEKLYVDHNHTTGALRDLLCLHCNSAIGQLREDPEIFYAAIRYLERHRLRVAG